MASVKPGDFAIDEYNLDKECARQSNLYRKYAEAAADARKRYDEGKQAESVTRADVELQVRKDPDSFGVAKVTEGVIKSVVDADERIGKAVAEVIDARHDMDVMQAAVGALDHKKKALGDMVSLFLADYYSEPRTRSGDREAEEEFENRRMRKDQRRKRDAG